MKKAIYLFISCLCLVALFPSTSFAQKEAPPPTYVFVDGKEPQLQIEPYIENGSTMVELRPILEMLGFELSMNESESKLTAKKNDTVIVLYLNHKKAYTNQQEKQLQSAPVLKEGRVIAPLTFIAEATDKKVYNDRKTNMIIMNDGEFKNVNFSSPKFDQKLLTKAERGYLGPFHISSVKIPIGEIVNKLGFPDQRYNGTSESDDIPYLSYGDYRIYFSGEKGDDFLVNPNVAGIAYMLPQNTTNQDVINKLGTPQATEESLYTSSLYRAGQHTLAVESDHSARNSPARSIWLQ